MGGQKGGSQESGWPLWRSDDGVQLGSACSHHAVPPPPAHPTEAVRIGGTVRHTSDEGMAALRKRLEESVAATAAAHGCTAEVRP